MVGIVITGHARFASGLKSSIELLAGSQENLAAIDFEDDVEKLQSGLLQAAGSMKEAEGILVFCDLAGGTPFKTAVTTCLKEQVTAEIIAGSNLPMIAETVLARKFGPGLQELTEMAINTGRNQIFRFDFEAITAVSNEETTEGI